VNDLSRVEMYFVSLTRDGGKEAYCCEHDNEHSGYVKCREFFTLAEETSSEKNGAACSSSVNRQFKGKGKAIPLQAWTGPEDCRRLRLLDFKTIGT
jgi:hypothetical protein